MKVRITLILFLNLLACAGFSQSILKTGLHNYAGTWGEPDSLDAYQFPSDTLYFGWRTGNCKGLRMIPLYLYAEREDTVTGVRIRSKNDGYLMPAKKHTPLITVHGNIMYDLYYQSHADTPYLEREIYQHTLQTTLDITLRNQYPLRVAFSTTKSNASLLRSITGLNLQYANRDFKNALLAKAQAWDAGKVKQWQEIQDMKLQLNKNWDSLYRMKSWFNAPEQIQRMVEARERELYGKAVGKLPELPNKPHLPLKDLRNKLPKLPVVKDSTLQTLQQEYELKAAKIDSLQKSIARAEALYEKKLGAYGLKKETLVGLLTRKASPKELISHLEGMNLPDSILPKGYKTLLSLRTVGIGRTMVDYSELTARNISIIGVQAELNPSWYLAVASGAVDYRFRDFVVNTNRQRQYLNMVRVGKGMKDGNNVILSYYTGKKQAYNFGSSQQVTVPDNRIMGFSLEGRWQLDKNTYFIGEAAKSSMPSHVRVVPKDDGLGGSMLRFSDRSNEAYAISSYTFIPATGTRLSGMYKMMGANFQSFSLYASGSKQSGWMLKADQPFFKQQLTISASLRKNTYTSIFETSSYMSNTVFKSIQATFRRRNWPVVSLGYFPSSQLMKLGEDRFMENMFYTMTGTVSHYYKYRNTGMNTMFSGTRFYNRQADSNFVYFNSTNLLLNQAIFFGRLTLNGTVSSATNQDYALFGADGNAQYKIRSWLDAGGGLKYNYQTVYRLRQVGYTANVRVDIPKIGEIMLMADQGFVPGADKKLVPNKTGRLTYTRIF